MRQVTEGETPIAAAAARVPRCAGVYFLLGDDRELLYVGKAANLRARLRAARLSDTRPARTAPGAGCTSASTTSAGKNWPTRPPLLPARPT